MVNFGIALLVLLAANIAVGIWRKLHGGPLLPPPAPDDDATVQDRNGRWWRVTPTGEWEDAFKRVRKRR